MANPQRETKVNKRGAARLAAVQALYQMEISGGSITEIVAEYEAMRIGKDVDGETYLEADLSWFRGLVGGVVSEQTALDPMIHSKLPADWPLSRIDALLRSVLRCGAFELKNRKDVPVGVIIDEYLEVAKSFFESPEPGLVNAVLDAIGREARNKVSDDEQAG